MVIDAQNKGGTPALLQMHDLLHRSLTFDSISGNEKAFVEFVADWARQAGFRVDLWQSSEAELGDHPLASARHIPVANRPTLLIKHPANPNAPAGRSLLFNAHSDVVAAADADAWTHPPFAGAFADGKFFGRGACDVKGPMVAALGAMLALRRDYPRGLAGDVSLELVPGEEDCVGLGTLTSVVRGHRADGVIVLEPTEDQPRNASRGGCRFDITCRGRSVHGTVKWLGEDAITLLRHVLDVLQTIEADWNDRTADPLFERYPIARPITVDAIAAGRWQGMLADRATCGGYLELLPGDDVEESRRRFVDAVRLGMRGGGQEFHRVEITFSESYNGHRTRPDEPICRLAAEVAGSVNGSPVDFGGLAGFNSGCEAGLRAVLLKTPTLVWGPGSLAQAHAVDEFVEWDSVQRVAGMFAAFAGRWCGAADAGAKGSAANED